MSEQDELLKEIKDIIHKRVRLDFEEYPVGFEEYGCAEEILAKAKPIIEKQEASDIIRCVKDAKRVHPNWGMDDVIELLEFREETRQALQSQSGEG